MTMKMSLVIDQWVGCLFQCTDMHIAQVPQRRGDMSTVQRLLHRVRKLWQDCQAVGLHCLLARNGQKTAKNDFYIVEVMTVKLSSCGTLLSAGQKLSASQKRLLFGNRNTDDHQLCQRCENLHLLKKSDQLINCKTISVWWNLSHTLH